MDIEFIVIIIFVGSMAALITHLIHRSRLKVLEEKLLSVSSNEASLIIALSEEKEMHKQAVDNYHLQQEELIQWKSEYKSIRQRFNEEEKDAEKKLVKFENLANKVLEHQKQSFDDYNKKSFNQIIEPLKTQIRIFEQKVEKTNQDAVHRHASLKEQIRNLNERGEKISKEANNLTKALKGDSKLQGNWGELILESVLDRSGLVKDREYFIQVSERDREGNILRPDVVIALPDGKKLIIDSKVSLRAYDVVVGTQDEEVAKHYLSAHVKAVKDHIDKLTVKNYHNLYQIESPDFVMMFVPIDTAFSAALKGDPHLYQYAFDKNIVIVTPSTLLATLKTVETLWRNDKQHRHALEIANEAGKMYDKFVGFTDDMQKLGTQLDTVQSSYHNAMSKLKTGQGNLVRKSELIRELGAKTNKKMSVKLIQSTD